MAVVGAGLSGLTCARILARKFDTVHLFDFGETRLCTGDFGKATYELGAMAFGDQSKYIGALIKELQLETVSFDTRMGDGRFFWDGEIVNKDDIGRHAGVGDMSYDEIFKKYFISPIENTELSQEELDQLSARAFFEISAPKEAVDFLEHDLFGTVTAPGLSSVSALMVVQYMQEIFSSSEGTKMVFQQIKGGNQEISRAYRKLIQSEHSNVKWHTDTKVTKLAAHDRGYAVSACNENGQFTIDVDDVVICTALHDIPELEPAMKLPPVPYIEHLRVFLHLRHRFWGKCGCIISNDSEIGWVEDHTYDQKTETGVLELHLCGKEAGNLRAFTDAEVVEEAIRRLSKIWPEILDRDILLGSRVQYWPYAMSYFPPGTRLKYREELLSTRIKICGEHTALQVGSLDGAVQSAVEVCARMGRDVSHAVQTL